MSHPRSCLVPTVAAVLFVACQSADHQTKADSTAVATRTAPAINVVTVHASDYAFQGPASIPAGMTTFHLINDGPGIHHLTIVRLDSAKTVADLAAAMKHPGPLPAWAVFAGGPNAPDPHDTSDATVDLSAGQYALMCFVDVPGGVPHFARGMSAPLTVTASSGPTAPAPTADVTITLSDYAFDVTGPLSAAGAHTIVVRSLPGQPHELELVRLEAGKTAADFAKWVYHMQGPPPGSAFGGVTTAAANVPVYFTVNLAPGTYALMCFVPDAHDGKPHTAHGMMKTITVT